MNEEVHQQLRSIRESAKSIIRAAIEKHGKTASWTDSSNPPILFDADNDELVVTLDRIYIGHDGDLIVDGSSSWDCYSYVIDMLGVEALVEIADDIETNDNIFDY